MARFILKAHDVLSVPISILFILNTKRMHPAYRMSWFRKLRLGFKMFCTTLYVQTGTSYKTHLAVLSRRRSE